MLICPIWCKRCFFVPAGTGQSLTIADLICDFIVSQRLMRQSQFGTPFDSLFVKTEFENSNSRRDTMKRMLLVLMLGLSVPLIFIGCGTDSAIQPDNQDSIADQFGGYTPTDEFPAFGETDLAGELEGDVEYDDPVLIDPVVEDEINSAASIFALRIVWGRLEYDSTVTAVTDWTGSLSVSWGSIVVRRTIRFEPATDWVLPRTDRKLVEFVSKTTVHNDGLHVNVYQPPSVTDDIKTITLETAPYSVTFDVNDLTKMDTIIQLDDGNAVSIQAHKLTPGACPRGFLGGFWGRDEDGNRIFMGGWMSANGTLMGYLKGTWGEEIDGIKYNVFYGKYIDINGQFEGLIKGTYGPVLSANSFDIVGRVGKFFGYYYDANGNILGVLGGHYRPVRNTGYGVFHGRWRQNCASVTANSEFDGLE